MAASQTLAHDHPEHARSFRPERHTDADFIGPPRHGVGGESVDANAGQKGREQAEESGKPRDQALTRQGTVDLFDQSPGISDRQAVVHLGDGLPNFCDDRLGFPV